MKLTVSKRLFKGSVTPNSETTSHCAKLERPTTLRELKTIYNPQDNVLNGCNDAHSQNEFITASSPSSRHTSSNSVTSNGTDKTVSMSILSPFDEQEEWAKISEIMASFGNGVDHKSIVTELEQEFESRLGFNRLDTNSNTNGNTETTISFTTVGQWLQSLELGEFENAFLNFGYDDINFINGVINDCDLKEIGVMNECDREMILKQCTKLPNRVGSFWSTNMAKNNANNVKDLVKEWLDSINLGFYSDTFRRNLYNDMERIKRIWEVELTAFLEITKPGHRRRILASVSEGKLQCPSQPNQDTSLSTNLDDLHADLDQLKSNIQELEEEIRIKNPDPVNNAPTEGVSTLRYRKKSRPAPPPPPATQVEPDLEIRNPSELLVGVPATLKAQWRHKPSVLVTGTVDYTASYLGSTVVKELRGTESTKKSIQKLKKSTSVVDCRITPEIILAISYRGVKFLNVSDYSSICEHEIRNIHCACQDSEDLTHFAYITKDRASKTHYCHVFCVQTMDQATEVILTLGEAFEVAYQMALKEHFGSTCNGHTRSHSANSITPSLPQSSLKKNSPRSPKRMDELKTTDAKYFVRNKDRCIPLTTLIVEGRFQEIKKLLRVENASDAKALKRLVLCLGNRAFRESNRIEKDVADEIFTLVVNELNYRSENTTQLTKYYHSSYPSASGSAWSADASRSPCVDRKSKPDDLASYFVRDRDRRVPVWTMMVEERYADIKRALNATTLSDADMFRRLATDMADKTFRENYRIEKDVADEIFECAADELMAREGIMAQLLECYNNSYN